MRTAPWGPGDKLQVAISGDEVGELYARVFPLIVRKCARILGPGPSAQDVAQETFVRLWQHRRRVREPEATLGWVYTTATRLALKEIKNGRREEVPEEGTIELVDFDPNPEVLSVNRASLRRVASQVSERDWTIAVLVYVDGMKHDEVAALLKCSDRTVRRGLESVRAAAQLRKAAS